LQLVDEALYERVHKEVFERIASEASKVAQKNKRSLISEREIEAAVDRIVPGQLSLYGKNEGRKAIAKYEPKRTRVSTIPLKP
jgi:histone H2B